MDILHIQLLGEFRLVYGETLITTVNSPRLQSLLAYLLLHRKAPQARQHLAFLFWPDTNENQALTNLRNLVYKMRQALPSADQFLLADTQTLQWRTDAAFTFDVADFEQAMSSATTPAALEQAVTLYGGQLLPGCYDDWLRPLREDLQQKVLAALERLIGLLEGERDYRRAIRYSQRLLQLDPLNETTYGALMRLYAASGDRASALQTYQQCMEILRQELDVEPAPSTQELYVRLLNSDSGLAAKPFVDQERLPLIGRTHEWQTLVNSWYRASSGKPHYLLLTGEAGIGKTRLAEEFLLWGARQGAITATARCYAVEGTLAYAPIVAWLRSERLRQQWSTLEPFWLTELVRLLPEVRNEQPTLPQPGALTESWQRQRLFDALGRAIWAAEEKASKQHPIALLLFVDDLQWCDQDTLAWLHYLLRSKTQARLLLIATLRAEEVLDGHPLLEWLAALRHDGLVTELTLDRLNIMETAALAEQLAMRVLDPTEQAQLYHATEGNPLFVVESIRSLAAPNPPPTTDERIGVWARGELPTNTTSLTLPSTLQAIISRRLAQLSMSARQLAGLAATVGRTLSFAVLAHASELAEEQLVNQLDELCQRRILCERGSDGYDFTHDRLREVAYNTLSAARRRLLHRRVAEALAATYPDAMDEMSGQMAVHYELAGLYEQAIPYYQRAAEVAHQIYANADAIHHYRAALALLPKLSSQARTEAVVLNEVLGDLLHLTTHFDEASASYEQALSAYSPTAILDRARLHCKIGNCGRDRYDFPGAQSSYQEAVKALGAIPSADTPDEMTASSQSAWWQAWIQVHLEMYMLYYWLNEVEASVELDQRLQPVLAKHGTRNQQVSYLLNRNRLELMRNHFHATPAMVRSSRVALALLQEAGDQARMPSTYFSLGFNLLLSEEPHSALEPLHTALQLAEQRGDTNLQTRCLAYLTVAYRQCENLVETQQLAERTQAVALVAQMPEYAGMSLANLAWVAWRRGDRRTAKMYGIAALERWEQSQVPRVFIWMAIWPLLAVAQAEQQYPTAITYIRQLFSQNPHSMPAALTSSLEQAIQAWEAGQVSQTDSLLQQALRLAQQVRYL